MLLLQGVPLLSIFALSGAGLACIAFRAPSLSPGVSLIGFFFPVQRLHKHDNFFFFFQTQSTRESDSLVAGLQVHF